MLKILNLIREKLSSDINTEVTYDKQDMLLKLNNTIIKLEDENAKLRLELRRLTKGRKGKEEKYNRHKKVWGRK